MVALLEGRLTLSNTFFQDNAVILSDYISVTKSTICLSTHAFRLILYHVST